jgi:hypothetical protein
VSTENQQEWRRIAEQASYEQDSARLVELANKLAELLGDREHGEKPHRRLPESSASSASRRRDQ